MSIELRPPSANEGIKERSRYLRGTIADGLTRVETGALSDDDAQLTKFHGIYLQDDRDLRAERGRKKMEKAFIFMARLRVPGGVLTIPSRQITFPDYYIGKYPVTVAQFRRFVTDQNYVTDAEKLGKGSQLVNRVWTEVAGASWKNPGFSQKDDHPVVMVTLADAEAFARWAAKHTKKEVILPNEVESEYAARGAEPQFYPWGNTWDGFKSNHADISLKNTNNAPQELKCSNDNDMYPYTAPVGAYKNASWCGAYDMSGNVWQWCEHPRNELRRGWQHGGSWCTPPESCQTSSHRREDPDTRSSTVGFRVAIRPGP